VIQALASFLCDVLNEININSSIDDLKTEKNFIFKEHIKYYQKEDVIIYDRHYADYSVLASHAKSYMHAKSMSCHSSLSNLVYRITAPDT
jgi:hypothetical protein